MVIHRMITVDIVEVQALPLRIYNLHHLHMLPTSSHIYAIDMCLFIFNNISAFREVAQTKADTCLLHHL